MADDVDDKVMGYLNDEGEPEPAQKPKSPLASERVLAYLQAWKGIKKYGPWKAVEPGRYGNKTWHLDCRSGTVARGVGKQAPERAEAFTRFIAASCNLGPLLARELIRLRNQK